MENQKPNITLADLYNRLKDLEPKTAKVLLGIIKAHEFPLRNLREEKNPTPKDKRNHLGEPLEEWCKMLGMEVIKDQINLTGRFLVENYGTYSGHDIKNASNMSLAGEIPGLDMREVRTFGRPFSPIYVSVILAQYETLRRNVWNYSMQLLKQINRQEKEYTPEQRLAELKSKLIHDINQSKAGKRFRDLKSITFNLLVTHGKIDPKTCFTAEIMAAAKNQYEQDQFDQKYSGNKNVGNVLKKGTALTDANSEILKIAADIVCQRTLATLDPTFVNNLTLE